jgi:MULE transposase domain
VSGFLYKTNATFSINTRRLPLSMMVGINNTKYTFPIAFMFITTESAKSFKFARECLTDLYFYNCPQPSLICGDFSKGLGAAVAAQAAKDLIKDIKDNKFIDINDVVDLEAEQDSEFLEGTIIVNIAIGIKGERTRL